MTVPQYRLNAFQATSGFSADDGRLTDGVLTAGSGWEATGGSSSGSTASVTALYDLGASPSPVNQVGFTVSWEGTPSVVLDYSNDGASWTTANTVTTPTGSGTLAAHSYSVAIAPAITARYWRLSAQDTSAGGFG